MLDFANLNNMIQEPDAKAAAAAAAHWDAVAKPLKGLGKLEDLIIKIAALKGAENFSIKKRSVIVLCADNGVVAEGVTQTDASVTAAMAGQIRDHRSSVCLMGASAGADVIPYDMGMLTRVSGVDGCHISDGTGNIAKGPAMTKEQAVKAISYGISLVKEYRDKGYELLITGEMGIGNTTTSSAVTAALLNLDPSIVTDRGAGLSDEGLKLKIATIKKAFEVNAPDLSDPLDILSKLGGFDIAGMVGLFIGGAIYRIPVIIDGLISSAAALLASRLCPNSIHAMLASHCSAESAAMLILNELALKPVIFADMKLGEGTGAVCLIPLLDMALSVYNGSAAFSDTGIKQYEHFEGELS